MGLDGDSHDIEIGSVTDWLVAMGLRGLSRLDLLDGYCRALAAAGIPLMRFHCSQRAFHPEFGGIGFNWSRDAQASETEYSHEIQNETAWRQSPFRHLLDANIEALRVRLGAGADPAAPHFPIFDGLAAQGGTDYLAMRISFEDPDAPLDPDTPPVGATLSWTTDAPDGFTSAQIAALKRTLPVLGLALKAGSYRRTAQDLLAAYLGGDAGTRVLSGAIRRGSLDEIDAAICLFDLTGFTSLAERMDGAALIDMLNDYFGLAVGVIEAHGGNVLKFMGDGMLAIFAQPPEEAARAALDAAAELDTAMRRNNDAREAQGAPCTGFTLALHAGRVLYGNIGAQNRLDFTVIGPAVNLTARLSGMHKAVGRDVVISGRLAELAQPCGHDIVSLGRYMLRGVAEPQELFTLHAPS
jgi:adenylate cyclase